MNKGIEYKGTDITEIYKLALIGADFATEKNENGIALVNSLNKELYTKTVLLARLLNVINIPEDRVMNLEQYRDNDFTVASFSCGRNTRRLKADYDLFTSMLDNEIQNALARNNNIVTLIDNAIKTELTPETVEKLNKSKDELIEKLDAMKSKA